MPSQPRTQGAAPAASEPPAESLYPHIEGFVEYAGAPEIDGAFASIKEGLDALKGPKVEHGKKVRAALERTEELLHKLLQVREKLETAKKGKK